MNEENNLDGLKKLEETLHKKSALSSLRTYQGDMAKFIKDKNESVISVAIKEKERKEEREEKQENKPVKKTSSFQANLMIIISTFLLIVGGFTAFIFVWQGIHDCVLLLEAVFDCFFYELESRIMYSRFVLFNILQWFMYSRFVLFNILQWFMYSTIFWCCC